MKDDSVRFVVLGLIFGGGLIVHALRRQKLLAKVRNTPRSKIATAPQGLVEVEGFAWSSQDTFKSSQGRELVYYFLDLQREESRGSGKNRRTEWVSVFQFSHNPPVLLLDSTGAALLHTVDAQLEISDKRTESWRGLSTKEQEAILSIDGIRSVQNFPPSNFLFGIFSSKFRIIETEIKIGAPLYVNGIFRTDSTEKMEARSLGLTEFRKKIFDLKARTEKNFSYFLDKDQNGKITEKERRTGYCNAAHIARQKALSSTDTTKSNEEPVFISGHIHSDENHQLIIADCGEEHFKTRVGRFLLLSYLAGALLISISFAPLIDQIYQKKKANGSIANSVNSAQAGQNNAAAQTIKDDAGEESLKLEARSIRQKHEKIKRLHDECTRGLTGACETLLNHKLDYSLTQEYVTYYRSALCRDSSAQSSPHCQGYNPSQK